MNNKLLLLLISLFIFSCKKQQQEHELKAFTPNETQEITNSSIESPTDLIEYRPVIKFSKGTKKVNTKILYDNTVIQNFDYSPSSEDESMSYDGLDIPCLSAGGGISSITLQITATYSDDRQNSIFIKFIIVPVDPVLFFRDFDMRTEIKVKPGDSITLLPSVSIDLNREIVSMESFLKEGFKKEKPLKTYTKSDFYFYQRFIREVGYTVPSGMPSGSSVYYRFNLKTSNNTQYSYGYKIIVQ